MTTVSCGCMVCGNRNQVVDAVGLKMAALFEFLQKNQIEKASTLPAVHSTEAYFIKKFIKSNHIDPQPCKFFRGEKLSYFFVGRPAFKRSFDYEPDYWELPMCFVVEYSVTCSP